VPGRGRRFDPDQVHQVFRLELGREAGFEPDNAASSAEETWDRTAIATRCSRRQFGNLRATWITGGTVNIPRLGADRPLISGSDWENCRATGRGQSGKEDRPAPRHWRVCPIPRFARQAGRQRHPRSPEVQPPSPR